MDDVMSMGGRYSLTETAKGKNQEDCVIEMTNAMNTERAMLGRDRDPTKADLNRTHLDRNRLCTMRTLKKVLNKIGKACLCLWVSAVIAVFTIYILDSVFGIHVIAMLQNSEGSD